MEPTGQQPNTGEIAAIYLEDPAQEPQWEKIHIRGVDDLSTDNIRTFASDYYSDADPYVQWVDDHSANLVYKDKSVARQAILTFTQQPVTEQQILNNPFELHTARPLVTKPASLLTVRIAMMADKKKKGAKDASRYYLLNPSADPAERQRREKNARGDSGDYKRRRFDDREHKRRQRHQDDNADTTNDFEASMYDDAPSTEPSKDRGRDLFSRISKPRHRSASPVTNADAISLSDSDQDTKNRRKRNGYRNRDSPPLRSRNNAGRELFDSHDDSSTSRRGMRSDNLDLFSRRDQQNTTQSKSNTTSLETNQGAARLLRADLKAAQNQQSPARSHRRSHAMDRRNDEDLVERFARKSISLDSTKSVTQKTGNSGKELFMGDNMNMNGNGSSGSSIKGSASQGMSIKGRADNVKELFPDRFSSGVGGRGNAGKELFDQPVRARPMRQKAGDLFD